MAQTLAQITKQIKQLQKEADALRNAELKGVVDRIKAAISHYDLTADQLGFGKPAAKTVAAVKPVSKPGRKTAASLFSNEESQVWSGRGPRPRWLREALASGHSLDEFRVGSKVSTPKPVATPAQSAVLSTLPPQAEPNAVTKRARVKTQKPTIATKPIPVADEGKSAQDVAASVAAPKPKRQAKTTTAKTTTAKSPRAKKSLAKKIASVAVKNSPRPKSKRPKSVSAAANKAATAVNAETSEAAAAELAAA